MDGVAQGEDEGTELVPVVRYLETREGEKPLGVYALYNAAQILQYVGYARNMPLAIKVGFSKRAESWAHSNCQCTFGHAQCRAD